MGKELLGYVPPNCFLPKSTNVTNVMSVHTPGFAATSQALPPPAHRRRLARGVAISLAGGTSFWHGSKGPLREKEAKDNSDDFDYLVSPTSKVHIDGEVMTFILCTQRVLL